MEKYDSKTSKFDFFLLRQEKENGDVLSCVEQIMNCSRFVQWDNNK